MINTQGWTLILIYNIIYILYEVLSTYFISHVNEVPRSLTWTSEFECSLQFPEMPCPLYSLSNSDTILDLRLYLCCKINKMFLVLCGTDGAILCFSFYQTSLNLNYWYHQLIQKCRRSVFDVTALYYWQASCDQQNSFVTFNSTQPKVSGCGYFGS